MKRVFVVYSVLVAVMVSWSVLFKALCWPGGAMMVFITAAMGVVASIWGAFVHLKLGKLGKGVVVYDAIVAALTFISLVMVLGHYPGRAWLAIVTLGLLVPVAIVCSVVSHTRRNA